MLTAYRDRTIAEARLRTALAGLILAPSTTPPARPARHERAAIAKLLGGRYEETH